MTSQRPYLFGVVALLCILPRLSVQVIYGSMEAALTQIANVVSQYDLKCNDRGDRRPNVSINPRAYPNLLVCRLSQLENFDTFV